MGETAQQRAAPARQVAPLGPTEPPRWVLALTDAGAVGWLDSADGFSMRVRAAGRFQLVSVRVGGAVALAADELRARTRRAYGLLAERLAGGRARHAVRIWNFIPGILAPLDDLAHRYMAFNAGRYTAFEEWDEGRDSFGRFVPTASGVGHGGEDLVIHCLAATSPGTPVENPRQVPSYCYSKRYGPLPPCFARATLVDLSPGGSRSLLVGGTASVRGEESVHPADLEAQAEETLENLAALVATGIAACSHRTVTWPSRQELLDRFRSVRVYYPREQEGERVWRVVCDAFPGADEVELLQADLCRAPLRVEVEGVADLAP